MCSSRRQICAGLAAAALVLFVVAAVVDRRGLDPRPRAVVFEVEEKSLEETMQLEWTEVDLLALTDKERERFLAYKALLK